MATDNTAPQAPARYIGRYRVVRELARSNDIVYEATDPTMNRRIALKQLNLPANLSGEQKRERIERFKREARAAGALNHKNIVTIYEIGQDKDIFFIAMEFLTGQSLRSYMAVNGPLPVRMAMQIALEMCDALGYAHSHNVIHRDVKPDNLHLIPPSNTVKLTDFGIARVMEEVSLTATGQVFGTPSYMSPEQLSARKVDHRTDLFSLGVMLYEILTGRKPFHGDNIVSVTYQIMNAPVTFPAGMPAGITAILRRALAKDPDQRYQNAAAMAADIRSELTLHDPPYAAATPTLPSAAPTSPSAAPTSPPEAPAVSKPVTKPIGPADGGRTIAKPPTRPIGAPIDSGMMIPHQVGPPPMPSAPPVTPTAAGAAPTAAGDATVAMTAATAQAGDQTVLMRDPAYDPTVSMTATGPTLAQAAAPGSPDISRPPVQEALPPAPSAPIESPSEPRFDPQVVVVPARNSVAVLVASISLIVILLGLMTWAIVIAYHASITANDRLAAANACNDGVTAYEAGHYEEAVDAYAKAIKIAGANTDIIDTAKTGLARSYVGLGDSQFNSGDKTDALASYQAAVGYDAGNAQAYYGLAELAPDDQTKIGYLDEAIRDDPTGRLVPDARAEDAAEYSQMANQAMSNNDQQTARNDWLRVIELLPPDDPLSQQAHQRLDSMGQ